MGNFVWEDNGDYAFLERKGRLGANVSFHPIEGWTASVLIPAWTVKGEPSYCDYVKWDLPSKEAALNWCENKIVSFGIRLFTWSLCLFSPDALIICCSHKTDNDDFNEAEMAIIEAYERGKRERRELLESEVKNVVE